MRYAIMMVTGISPVAMDTSGNSCVVHTEYVNVMYERAKSRDDYEQPVQMYRRLLSESEGKINIVTLGFLQNIQDLMNSNHRCLFSIDWCRVDSRKSRNIVHCRWKR